jgi:spermidine synthase
LRLRIDNRQQEGSSATGYADARQALLPALLHPAPRHALFLGLGTGVTAAAAADDPTLEVDAVELLPEVIKASARFIGPVGAGSPRPRVRLVAADARRFVRASERRYDLIVSDNFHPARSGSGSLCTVEHFRAVRQRLAPQGLFCQWLPLHQLDLATLRSIVASFIAVYPAASALLATNSLDTPVLGLVGRADSGRFVPSEVRSRLAGFGAPDRAAALGIDDELALLGSFVAGPKALQRLASGARSNTDDRPIVAYQAPRITYAADSLPRDRLLGLLSELTIEPAELISAPLDPAFVARLAAYWRARDRFIAAGRGVLVSGDVREMLAQVREPLLEVLRIEPGFRPAYDPLLQMATVLARSDPGAARVLLGELARLQPARPEAAQRLQQMGPD